MVVFALQNPKMSTIFIDELIQYGEQQNVDAIVERFEAGAGSDKLEFAAAGTADKVPFIFGLI